MHDPLPSIAYLAGTNTPLSHQHIMCLPSFIRILKHADYHDSWKRGKDRICARMHQ